jgi:hypothetical protein
LDEVLKYLGDRSGPSFFFPSYPTTSILLPSSTSHPSSPPHTPRLSSLFLLSLGFLSSGGFIICTSFVSGLCAANRRPEIPRGCALVKVHAQAAFLFPHPAFRSAWSAQRWIAPSQAMMYKQWLAACSLIALLLSTHAADGDVSRPCFPFGRFRFRLVAFPHCAWYDTEWHL